MWHWNCDCSCTWDKAESFVFFGMESFSTYKHLPGNFHSCFMTNLQVCVSKQSKFGFCLEYSELSKFTKFGQDVSAKMRGSIWPISLFIVWCGVCAQVSWTAKAGRCRISSLFICTWNQWKTLFRLIQSIRNTLVSTLQPGKVHRLCARVALNAVIVASHHALAPQGVCPGSSSSRPAAADGLSAPCLGWSSWGRLLPWKRSPARAEHVPLGACQHWAL